MKKMFTTLCLSLALGLSPAWGATEQSPSAKVVQGKARKTGSTRVSLRPQVNFVQLKGLEGSFPAPKAASGRVPRTGFSTQSRVVRPPMRVGSTGSTIYGWLTSYNDPMGLYPMVGVNEVSLDGKYTNVFNRNDATSGGGFIRDGHVCVFSLEALGGEVLGAFYREFDLKTGEMVVQQEIDTTYGMNNIYVSFAYDETADMVYGYAYNREGSGYTFSCSPGYDPTNLTVVRELVMDADPTKDTYAETCTSMTFNAATGKIMGVNLDKNLVEIATDGTQTSILSLKNAGSNGSASGLVYSPVDGKYVWNCSDNYGGAYLYAIDPVTKKVEKLVDYELGEVFAFFVTSDDVKDNLAPVAPEIVSNTFAGSPALSGSFSIKIPATFADGKSISGNVTLTSKVDGDVKTSTHAAGSTATVKFDNIAEGMHSFIFSASVAGHDSKSVRRSMFVGYDAPCQPAEVTVTDTQISWSAVTEGANGGYINPAEVTYDVVLDGVVLQYDVKGTSLSHDFGSSVESHIAEVCAKYHGKESPFTLSGKFVSGGAMTLPVHIVPTEAQADIITVIDANLDNYSWYWAHDYYGNEFLAYEYSPTNNADDWVMLPAISFPDAKKRYELTFEAYNDLYDEKLEVCMGTRQAVSAMTTTIVPEITIENRDPLTYLAVFDVPAAGDYYLGFHAVSDPDRNRLYLQNIKVVESNISQQGPEIVTNLTAVATAPGELNAKVSFTMPTELVTGSKIDASATLTATVYSPVASVTISGKPGETLTTTVATQQGVNTIMVQPALGDDKGMKFEVDVYTGVDLPGRVQNLKSTMSADNNTIHLSWEPPVEGANGGYITQSGITYMLMGVVQGVFGNEMGIIDEIGTDVLEFDYPVTDASIQEEVILGVLAVNAAGQGPKYVRISSSAGRPYDLPITETFDNYMTQYSPILFEEPAPEYEDAVWGITNPTIILGEAFATESGGGMTCVSRSGNEPSKGRAALPKFATTGASNVVVSFDYAGSAADVEVYAMAYGIEPVRVGKISDQGYDGKGYATFKFTLPAQFNNLPWVQIYLDAVFSGSQALAFAKYDVRNYVADDLGVTSLKVPSTVAVGEDVAFKAELTNFGYEAASLPALKWQIVNGDNKVVMEHLAAADASVSILPGEKLQVLATVKATAEMAGEVEARLIIDRADANAENNKATLPFTINRGGAIAVTDLSAAHGDAGVTLTWTPPVSDRVQQSFEDEEPFEPNMDMLGGFRNIDRDGKEVYGFSGWENPNMGEPAAFTAYSAMGANAIAGFDGLYSASDGDIYLIAFSPAATGVRAPNADDWLISPEVQGGSEVTLDLRAITYQYGAETVEVLASSTNAEPESFKVVKTIKLNGNRNEDTVWETFAVTLPADAKYFAIHYASNDMMGVQLDNIHYVAANAVSPVTGYDIYRDGTLIAENVTAADGSYLDATTATGPVYSYYVVPVIGDKRLDQSNSATVDTSGLDSVMVGAKAISGGEGYVEIKGYAGCNIAVYAADGTLVAAQANASHVAKLPVATGVYIVKVANDVAKVLVK